MAHPRSTSLVIAGVALLSIACEQPSGRPEAKSAPDAAPEVRQRIAAVEREATSELWWPVCETTPRAGKGCGRITAEMSPEWIARFVRSACEQSPSEDLTPECRNALRRNVLDSFRKRYTRASESDIEVACRRSPARCERFDSLEMLYMMSHNGIVLDEADRRIAQISAEAAEGERVARGPEVPSFALDGVRRAMAVDGAAPRFDHDRGAFAGTSRQHGAPSGAPRFESGCRSDSDCGGPGYVCAKPTGSSTGECSRAVTGTGAPSYSPRPGGGLGIGERQCMTPTDCAPGFRCDHGRCMR